MDDDLLELLVLWMMLSVLIRRRRLSDRWRNRRWHVRPINLNRRLQSDYYHLLQELKQDETMFFRYLRMDLNTFNELLGLIHPLIVRMHPRALDSELRLALTLRYLATEDQPLSLALAYRIGESTARMIIKEVCQVLVHVLQPLYLRQPSEVQWKHIAGGFLEQWNLPNCIGAMDGKHFPIQAPANTGTQFFNYKKHFSIVLLAACDANYNFTVMNVGHMGSQSDAGIHANTFGQQLDDDELNLPRGTCALPGSNIRTPCFFVGDDAFPLSSRMMKPYSGHGLIEQRRIFNYRLSRARRVIENAFGILSSRWRIFRKPIALHPETTDHIILSAICLHNMLKQRDDVQPPQRLYCPPNFVDWEDEHGILQPGLWRERNGCLQDLPPPQMPHLNVNETGIEIRNKLTAYFLTEEGEVPWQYEYIRYAGPQLH